MGRSWIYNGRKYWYYRGKRYSKPLKAKRRASPQKRRVATTQKVPAKWYRVAARRNPAYFNRLSQSDKDYWARNAYENAKGKAYDRRLFVKEYGHGQAGIDAFHQRQAMDNQSDDD